MDVKDPILHGIGRNNLKSFVTVLDKNYFVVDLEGRSSLVKLAVYFDAEGVSELLMDHLVKFDRIELSVILGFACRKYGCLLYTSPSPRDQRGSRMPSSA